MLDCDILNSNLQPTIDYVTQLCIDNEERVVNQVLQSLLGRTATIEDYKKCNRLQIMGEPDWYDLAYEGRLLGRIHKYYPESPDFNFKITFTPVL